MNTIYLLNKIILSNLNGKFYQCLIKFQTERGCLLRRGVVACTSYSVGTAATTSYPWDYNGNFVPYLSYEARQGDSDVGRLGVERVDRFFRESHTSPPVSSMDGMAQKAFPAYKKVCVLSYNTTFLCYPLFTYSLLEEQSVLSITPLCTLHLLVYFIFMCLVWTIKNKYNTSSQIKVSNLYIYVYLT